MKKEQKELIALIFIITAIVISACVMLIIKPSLSSASEKKKSLRKVMGEIDKERELSRQLVELTRKKESLETRLAENEAGLFGGITVGDLSNVVLSIVRNRFPRLDVNYQGDIATVLPGERYNELTNTFTVKDTGFHEMLEFLSVLETANPGIRVANLEISTEQGTSTKPGMVVTGLNVKLVGMHEGTGVDRSWEPDMSAKYIAGELRNPFGPTGDKITVDPDKLFKDKAYNLRVTMTIPGDSIWINDVADESRGARECIIRRRMPIFEPARVVLLEITEDSFMVIREDRKKFKFVVRQTNETIGSQTYERGTIDKVIEID